MTGEAETICAAALTFCIAVCSLIVRHASESLTDPEGNQSLSIEIYFAPYNLAAVVSTIV